MNKKDLQRDRQRCTAHTCLVPHLWGGELGGCGGYLLGVKSDGGGPLVPGPVGGKGVPVQCQVWCQV